MDPQFAYWTGILLFFALGLGLLIRARAFRKPLVWLYLLLGLAVSAYIELGVLNKQFLPAVFRSVADVCLLLPVPALGVAVFLFLLNAVVSLLPDRWGNQRVSVLEVIGVALTGHFLFRLLLLLVLFAHATFA